MSDQLLKEASEMFENQKQWLSACKLADLIPEIKKLWFMQFIEMFSENIESRLNKDERFEAFQIITDTDNSDKYYCGYISPRKFDIKKDECDQPLGLSTGIEFQINKNEFLVNFGLFYKYEKKSPALTKLDKLFSEKLHKVLSEFNTDNKTNWNENGWIIWNCLSPKGKKADLSEPETIYYLHEKGQEFIDIIIEKILIFVSKHRDALISAHARLINQDFE